jgi:hypothetical protein
VASVSTYLEKYLQELQEIRSSGETTGETSYYPPLRELLNSVGDEIKPKVRCILILKNRGAGLLDGYYIGGYQVIKKWLSYREGKVARPGAYRGRGPLHPRHEPSHRRALPDAAAA